MNQYYAVIGFFIFTMVAALFYTLLNPTQSFAQMPVVDESAILVHNGQSHRFSQGANEFFRVSVTLSSLANLLFCLFNRTGKSAMRRNSSRLVCRTCQTLNRADPASKKGLSSPNNTTGVLSTLIARKSHSQSHPIAQIATFLQRSQLPRIASVRMATRRR